MKIIVGNWKMNGDGALVKSFVEGLNGIESENKIVVCPPAELICLFKNFKHNIGAQNCFWEDRGAFTGEISALSLKELGCKYVIIGHSERRNLFNESNDTIFKKWNNVVKNGLVPIVCVGEKDKNSWKDELIEQLKIFTNQDLNGTIIAYEPVWSIGTGEIPTFDRIAQTLEFIKDTLSSPPTLYGGSVNLKNYRQILEQKVVDGLLIGGASLELTKFLEICEYKNIQ